MARSEAAYAQVGRCLQMIFETVPHLRFAASTARFLQNVGQPQVEAIGNF